MTTTAQPDVHRATETRIASYLLVEYLERIGVEVIFGLCGHTNIAVLDALSKSRIRFITSRHEQVSAHSADGYARVTGKPGVVLSPSARADQCRDRRRQIPARLDSDGRDCRRRAVYYYGRHRTGVQSAPGCGPVPDLRRSASASTVIGPAICRASSSARSTSPSMAGPAGAGRRPDGSVLRGPAHRRVPQMPAEIARPRWIPRPPRERRILAEADRPLIYGGGGVLSSGPPGTGRARRGVGDSSRHSLMGKLPARGSSAVLGL